MQIIAGTARNIVLSVPSGIGVRPTAGRSRKALFDSLNSIFPGAGVLDLCSGSGALALEAASRGALRATLVESDSRHIRVIEENIAKVVRAGVQCRFQVVNAAAESTGAYLTRMEVPQLVVADPPYPISAELFRKILSDPLFCSRCAGALLVWELPDTPGSVGAFLDCPHLAEWKIRKFGGTDFLLGKVIE